MPTIPVQRGSLSQVSRALDACSKWCGAAWSVHHRLLVGLSDSPPLFPFTLPHPSHTGFWAPALHFGRLSYPVPNCRQLPGPTTGVCAVSIRPSRHASPTRRTQPQHDPEATASGEALLTSLRLTSLHLVCLGTAWPRNDAGRKQQGAEGNRRTSREGGNKSRRTERVVIGAPPRCTHRALAGAGAAVKLSMCGCVWLWCLPWAGDVELERQEVGRLSSAWC